MVGFEGKPFEDDSDFRRGDDAPDTHVNGFAVFGGAPADRVALQQGDHEMLEGVTLDLDETIARYEAEMRDA